MDFNNCPSYTTVYKPSKNPNDSQKNN